MTLKHRLLCAFVGALGTTFAFAQGKAHVHGVAELQVMIEGEVVEIELHTPLDSLIGFEHAPRTDKQRQTVHAMREHFSRPETLFAPTPSAQCTATPPKIVAPVLDTKNDAKQDGKSAHAGLEASVSFRCKRPAELKSIEVNLFDVFNRMRRIDAQLAGPRGQHAARLTPAKRRLSW